MPLLQGTRRALLGSGSVNYLLRDLFTGSDGTHLNAHTMDVGSGWTEYSGSWTISSNKAICTVAAGAQHNVAADAGNADVAVFADFTIVNSTLNDGGLVLRLTDDNNNWICNTNHNSSVFQLYDRQAGTYTQRASVAYTWTIGQTYTVMLVAVGATITGFVDGVQQWQYTSATFNQTATKHGIRDSSNDSAQSVDNFGCIAKP